MDLFCKCTHRGITIIILFIFFNLLGCSAPKRQIYIGAAFSYDSKEFSTQTVKLEQIQFDWTKMEVSFSGLPTFELIDCSVEGWVCFSAGFFKLAVPESMDLIELEEWNYHDTSYSLVSPKGDLYHSFDADLLFILGVPDDDIPFSMPVVYVYDRKDGLIGFIIQMSDGNKVIKLVPFFKM